MKIKIALAALACSGLVALLHTPVSAAPVSGIGQNHGVVTADSPLIQQVHRWWRRGGWGPYYGYGAGYGYGSGYGGYGYGYSNYRPYYPAYRPYYYGYYAPPPPPPPYYYYRPYWGPYY